MCPRRRWRGCKPVPRLIRPRSRHWSGYWPGPIPLPSPSTLPNTVIAWRPCTVARHSLRLVHAPRGADGPFARAPLRRGPSRVTIRRTQLAQERRSPSRAREESGENERTRRSQTSVRYSDDATITARVRSSDGLIGAQNRGGGKVSYQVRSADG